MMIGSIPFDGGAKPFNATVFLRPGQKPEVVYRKIHLFDVDVPGAPAVRESETFSFGPEVAIVEWRGWKIGLSICYDVRFAELYRHYGRKHVDLILIPSAFLVPTGQAHWDILVRSRAIENQCFVVAAAQSGEHVSASGEKRHTYGHSMVVGPWGEKEVELMDDQTWGIARLEKSALEKTRARIPMDDHRRKRNWRET
jgi:nitrilase